MSHSSLLSPFKYLDQGHDHLSVHRSARTQPQRGPAGHNEQARCPASPLGSPWVSTGPGPRGRAARLRSHPSSPPLPSSCPLSAHSRPSTSAGPGPVCSHGKAAQGSSARMVCNPGIPSGHPEPTLTLHCSLKSPHPRVPAAAGGARAGWGWRGGRRCRGTQAGCLAYSAPPTRAPRQMELASAMGDSLVFPAP